MSSDDLYKVETTSVAHKRYIKKLEKRHKSHWSTTLKALNEKVKRIEALLETEQAKNSSCQ